MVCQEANALGLSTSGELCERSSEKPKIQGGLSDEEVHSCAHEFMTDTKGLGVMNYVFHGYEPFTGEIRHRTHGALVAMLECQSVAYALFNLQDRGKLFIGPGINIYMGQIVGEHCREGDLVVNPAKGKKLTNMRASGSDENVILTPPLTLSLEDCISYINDDELVEITPENIRLRKRRMPKW